MTAIPYDYRAAPAVSGAQAATPMVTWTGILVGGDGARFNAATLTGRSVQVAGELGGSTVTFEGSNLANPAADADWTTLPDLAGSPVSFSAAGLKAIGAVSLWVRPKVTGGDGTTLVTVSLLGQARVPR